MTTTHASRSPQAAPGFAIEFAAPMPGLGPQTAFELDAIAGATGLYALRAADAAIRLFVVDAALADPAYAPRVPASVRSELGAADGDPLELLVVANPQDDGVHVNLRAPIVLNRAARRAMQVILDDQAHPIRARLGDA